MLLEEFLQGNGHLLLDDAGIVHMTAQGKQLHAVIVLATEAVEPVGAAAENGGGHGHGLAVGDGGGTAVQTGIGGEWGLQTRLALLAFQRLQLGGLFTADVGTSTTVDEDVKVVATATGIAADEARDEMDGFECVPLLVSLVDGFFQANALVVEFTTNVDVGGAGVHGVTGNQTTFHQGVGILTDNFTILHRQY